ncbi:MAG: hypothetical protein MZU97_20710 [Bacillus subtilis]|nr:hypothetical protein [Bacillus subtilis]
MLVGRITTSIAEDHADGEPSHRRAFARTVTEKDLSAYVGFRDPDRPRVAARSKNLTERVRLGDVRPSARRLAYAQRLLDLIAGRERIDNRAGCITSAPTTSIPPTSCVEGHINYNVELGDPNTASIPFDAIRMATINAANVLRPVTTEGADRAGRPTPISSSSTILTKIRPARRLRKDGELVAKDGTSAVRRPSADALRSRRDDPSRCDFPERLSLDLPLSSHRVQVIGLDPRQRLDDELDLETVKVRQTACSRSIPTQRHLEARRRSNATRIPVAIGLGLVEGYGLKSGAVAMSIAHDSHNLIVIGFDR